MGAVSFVEGAVTKVGSLVEENKGVVRTVGSVGNKTLKGGQAVKAGEQAVETIQQEKNLYHVTKSAINAAKTGAAVLSTIPVVGEFLGTVPQVVLTGVEAVTDIAGGQSAATVTRNLAANSAQVAADMVPGGGLAMLAVKGGISVASNEIRGKGEDVSSIGGMPDKLPGKTPAANDSQHTANKRV